MVAFTISIEVVELKQNRLINYRGKFYRYWCMISCVRFSYLVQRCVLLLSLLVLMQGPQDEQKDQNQVQKRGKLQPQHPKWAARFPARVEAVPSLGVETVLTLHNSNFWVLWYPWTFHGRGWVWWWDDDGHWPPLIVQLLPVFNVICFIILHSGHFHKFYCLYSLRHFQDDLLILRHASILYCKTTRSIFRHCERQLTIPAGSKQAR